MPRKPNSREIPPRLELECLKVLWHEGEADGSRVREILASRELAYTTIVTLLERLVLRGAATRRKLGRRFLYAPAVDIRTLRALAVRELVDDFFEGSTDALARYAENGIEAAPPMPMRPALPAPIPVPAVAAAEPLAESAAASVADAPRIDTALL